MIPLIYMIMISITMMRYIWQNLIKTKLLNGVTIQGYFTIMSGKHCIYQ